MTRDEYHAARRAGKRPPLPHDRGGALIRAQWRRRQMVLCCLRTRHPSLEPMNVRAWLRRIPA